MAGARLRVAAGWRWAKSGKRFDVATCKGWQRDKQCHCEDAHFFLCGLVYPIRRLARDIGCRQHAADAGLQEQGRNRVADRSAWIGGADGRHRALLPLGGRDARWRPELIQQWSRTSFVGMAIFFTLSGYVIALSYGDWDWRHRPGFNLARLFFYRLARLYPAYLVFVIVIVLRWPALQDFSDLDAVSYLLPHVLLVQSWWPAKFGGDLAAHGHFHVSWSLSVEWALYLGFAIGAIIIAMLPQWRGKSLLLGAAFFIGVWTAVQRFSPPSMAPAGWSTADWDFWLFFYSPCAVSLQFGIGVAACRLSRLPALRPYLTLASEVGGIGLIIVYARLATGAPPPSTNLCWPHWRLALC